MSNSYQNGGEVIGSGGFGCVFSPALECKAATATPMATSKRRARSTNKHDISKLMVRKYAIEEYHLIQSIKIKLRNIPNYGHFFLLDDITICSPQPLTHADLAHFTSTCTALPKKGITAHNINQPQQTDKLMLLTMPNGGLSIDDYFDKYAAATPQNIPVAKINDNLINLLMEGILPMNRLNVYHCDVKSSNILLDSTLTPRLIDWGLSNQYVPAVAPAPATIPAVWSDYSVQFNTPISSTLFTEPFQRYAAAYQFGGDLSKTNMVRFVRLFVTDYIAAQKHYSVINSIFFMFFHTQSPPNAESHAWVNETYTVRILTTYLYELIAHYGILTPDGRVIAEAVTRYINEVYIHIVDVWGFIMSYLPIIEILYQNYDKLNQSEQFLFEQFKTIYLTYLYTPQFVPISVPALVRDLRALNSHFSTFMAPSKTTLARYSTYIKVKRRIQAGKNSLRRKPSIRNLA